MINNEQLRQIMPLLSSAKRKLYLPFLNRTMEEYEINTLLRRAAFLAQLAHESGEFRFMEEIWGPTEAQKRYEPPSRLAEKLGNTERGDGKRYKGRGPIQITGRFNYDRYGKLLGVDLVSNPTLASTPQIAFSIAGLYWRNNGLNQLADNDDITTITKRINGGLNGLTERRAYYKLAKEVLKSESPQNLPAELTRGLESILEETTTRQRRLDPSGGADKKV
ncbi:MAG: glycoside hydrolase family 19 protein [Acidobacteria bacterium]|nr:glycoside hydrolase family 19 protein [Acidobacteriota bacterium]